MQGHGAFARTALIVAQGHAHRSFASRSRRHQGLAVHLHPAAQFVDLGQGEPALPPVRFDLTPWQIGFGRHAPAKGRMVDFEDKLGDFPTGKPAQGLAFGRTIGVLPNTVLNL